MELNGHNRTMRPRAWFFLFLAGGWLGSCLPLGDLESYGPGNQGNPGGGLGGVAGAGTTEPAPLACGNGIVEGDEECDDAGISPTCTEACEAWSCPDGCACEPFGGSVLAVCQEEATWTGARQACSSYGLELAIPRSREENAFLRHVASREGLGTLHIAGTDSAEEGVWLRPDGTQFWQGGNAGEPVSGVFSNWGNGQPDNHQDAQHCASMGPAGTWDDNVCSLVRPFVCGRRPVTREGCGNGIVEGDEACDTGGSSPSCDEDCSVPRCGDGLVNGAAGEDCDDGNRQELDACDASCQKTGLIAHYPLSEKLGKVAWEVASLQHHGDLEGGASFLPSGEGIQLDGANHYVQVPIAKAPAIVDEITMMGLVVPDVPLTDGLHTIVGHVGVGMGETWLRMNGSILMGGSWWIDDEASAWIDVASPWTSSAPHHLAVRYNGLRWSLFIDGSLAASTGADTGALDLEGPWYLGGRPDGGGRYFAGRLSEVRLYDRPLDDDVIAAITAAALRDAP